MSARKKFFYNGTLLTIVGLSVKTVALLFGAFVSRTVGAEGMGLYTLVMTVYSFAITFATSGISLTVTRLVASAIGEGNSGNIGRIMRGATLYALAFSGAATAALLLGARFFGEHVLLDARSVLSLRILSASLIPTALASVISGYFVGIKRVGANAFVQVLTQLAKVLITAVLVVRACAYGTKMAVAALCVGISTAELISLLLMLVQYVISRLREGRGCPQPSASGAELRSVFGVALPLAFSAYVRSGLLTLEHMLIPKRLMKYGEDTSQALSSYGTLHGMALPMVLYPMSPLSSFSGLLVPEFAQSMGEGNKERTSRIASEAISATLIYATCAAVLLYLFSEEIGYIVYHSYEAGKYIALIAPIVPIMYLDHVTDSMLKGIGEQVYSMWINISDSCISILLVWFLIPKMGIAGYAVVIIVMEAYNFILSLLRLRSKVKFTFKPLKSVILPLVSSVLAAILSKNLFVMNGSTTSAYWLVMKMIFTVCVLFALIYVENGAVSLLSKTRDRYALRKY